MVQKRVEDELFLHTHILIFPEGLYVTLDNLVLYVTNIFQSDNELHRN